MSNDTKQATPQEAGAGFREAVIKGSWSEAFEYLTLEARKGIVGSLCMSAAYAAQDNKPARERLVEIMQKYGLLDQSGRELPADELLPVLLELLTWSDGFLPADRQFNLAQSMADTEYTGFRIQGDHAYAKATHKGRRSEQRFRRLGDRWYLS